MQIQVVVERDVERPKKFAVAVRDADGNLICWPARNLTRVAAARCLIPVRIAFLSAVAWMRDDLSSYLLSLNPHVSCQLASKDLE